jgi:hypothetical protein
MSDAPQKGNGTPDYWAGVRHGRMMTRIDGCVCAFDEDGNGPLNVCGAHQEWAAALVNAERERCVRIMQSGAEVMRSNYTDCGCHHYMHELIAEIRNCT